MSDNYSVIDLDARDQDPRPSFCLGLFVVILAIIILNLIGVFVFAIWMIAQ